MTERDEFLTVDLRRDWQRADPPEGAHLDDASWERMACEELTPFERDRALEHMTGCPACAAIYRGVADLRREAAAFDPAVAAIERPAFEPSGRPWRRPAWVAGAIGAAATVALLVIVGPFRSVQDYSDDVTRAGAPAVTILQPAEGAVFDRTFAWKPVPDATTYRLVVFTADGLRTFEARDLTSPAVTLTPDTVLPPGRYFWQVTALRDRQTVAQSPLMPFDAAR